MASTSCERCTGIPPMQKQRSQHHHVDHVETVEEYILDEQDFTKFQMLSMPRDNSIPHQRHVRRSAELRTVSIIETLSELVAGQAEGGKLEDCDGQCQRRLHDKTRQTFDGNVCRASATTRVCPCRQPLGRRIGGRCCDEAIVMDSTKTKTCEEFNGVVPPGKGSACCNDQPTGKIQNNESRNVTRCQGGDHQVRQEGCSLHCVLKCPSHVVSQDRPIQTSDTDCGHSMVGKNCASAGGLARSHFSPSPQKILKKTRMVANVHQEDVANCRSTVKCPPKVAAIQKGNGSENLGLSYSRQCAHSNHDPSHFLLSTSRSKGRTPDWIAGIFSIARRGNLERLSHALVGMDATLIRNLSDHRGNNLFHICCCYGHLDALQWLMQRGKQCEDAILDENKYELTPLVCAIKYGKLPCVEWLIQNTIARGQLVPSNGIRPLLHWAAKYGQEIILRWLAEYMEHNSMDINVKDGHGNTALHLAAKHGHAVSIKALVIHRCDASLKNDIGHKASDYALLYGQAACSEYLLSLEACLLLSAEVATLDADIYSSRAEMSETKIQFKDVLSCAKKLVKEREELSQHLDRLQDGLVHLNEVIITAIQGLCDENDRLREKVDGRRQCENSQSIDETIALCHAMQTRWKEGQQRWLSPSALSEIQQKILLAEERWKRARVRATWGDKESKEHINVFRDRLSQVHCRANAIRLSEIRSISSSESSLASIEDTMLEFEERYELDSSPTLFSPPFFNDNGNKLDKLLHHHASLPSESREDSAIPSHNVRHSRQTGCAGANKIELGANHRRHNLGFSAESSPFKLVSQNPKPEKNHPMGKKILPSISAVTLQNKDAGHRLDVSHNLDVDLVSQGTCKVLEVTVSSGNERDIGNISKCGNVAPGDDIKTIIHDLEQPWTLDAYSEKGLSNQVLNMKMCAKQCSSDTLKHTRTKSKSASVTARGHCKPEILEEQSHNRGDDDDETRNVTEQPLRPKDTLHKGICSGETRGKGGHSNSGRLHERQQMDPRETTNELSEIFEEFRMVTPPVPLAKSPVIDNNGILVSSEPDLIIGTKGIRGNHAVLNALPADIPEALSVDVVEIESTALDDRCNVPSMLNLKRERNDILAHEDETGIIDATEFGAGLGVNSESASELRLIEMDSDEACVGLVVCNDGNTIKRRGFLQKLHLRWPSKRKAQNSAKKVHEISAENFRETYLHVRNGVCENGEAVASVQLGSMSPSLEMLTLNGSPHAGINSSLEITDSQSHIAVDRLAFKNDSAEKQCAKSLVLINKEGSESHSTVGEFEISLPVIHNSSLEANPHLEFNADNISSKECISTVSGRLSDLPVPPLSKNVPSGMKTTPSKCTDKSESVSQGITDFDNAYSSSCPSVSKSTTEGIPVAPTGPRNIPVPPLPNEPTSGLDHQDDQESACESRNGYSYIMLPNNNSQNRQNRSDCSRDDDDDDDDEEQKDSCRPEADQVISLDKSLDIGLADDECNLIHAQANMPPQRPLPCGTKSERGSFLSRPESSASRAESYSAVFRLPGYPLRKVSSVSTDLLTPDSLTPNRMSPAPSEVSKTESALSPPSDISKTESVRHMRQLTRIEEKGKREAMPIPALPMKRLADVKVAAIVDINIDSTQKQSPKDDLLVDQVNAFKLITDGRHITKGELNSIRGTALNDKESISVPDVSNVTSGNANLSKEKPWYELSDDEEILMPETLRRNVGITKTGSEEDDVYSCA